jgi:hypothetical protein
LKENLSKTFLWLNKLVKMPLTAQVSQMNEAELHLLFCEMLCSLSTEFKNHQHGIQILLKVCHAAGAVHKKVRLTFPLTNP